MTEKDHLFAARACLAAASRTDSLRIRQLHVAQAANEIGALEDEIATTRILLAAQQAELLRLAIAADASAAAPKN